MLKRSIFRFLIIPTFLLISIEFAHAQAQISLTGAGNQHDIESWLSRNKLRNFGDEKGYVGERFFNENWLTGTIQTVDGMVLRNTDIKYDILMDQLITKINKTPFVLKSGTVDNFVLKLNGEELLFRSVVVDNKVGYLQVLHSGNTSLYVRHSTKIIKRDEGNQAYGSGVAYDKYVTTKEFYASIGDSQPVQLKNSKKGLVTFFTDRSDDIGSFIKKNKVNLKSDDGMTSVFEYYNQLNQ
ncbi:MAG: hypothetical protein RIM99_05720 [Cyclobacteriaceae bacterium]